jgi:hypothetical protein
MAARKRPSTGVKRDKLMLDAILLELNQDAIIEGKRIKNYRLVAKSLIRKALDGDVPAIKRDK